MRTPARTVLRMTTSGVLVALLASGCSGPGPDNAPGNVPRPAPPAASSSSPAAESTTTPATAASSPVPSTTSAPTSPAKPATDVAKAARLTAADLPGGGWQADPGPDFFRPEPHSSKPQCESAALLRSGPKPAASAESSFHLDGAFGTQPVAGAALVYPDDASAARAFTHILSVARLCRSWKNGALGSGYAFYWKQTVDKLAGHPNTPLLRQQVGPEGLKDVPPTLGGWSAHRQGRVLVVISSYFPAGNDRGAVGYGEMTALAEKLARRGAGA